MHMYPSNHVSICCIFSTRTSCSLSCRTLVQQGSTFLPAACCLASDSVQYCKAATSLLHACCVFSKQGSPFSLLFAAVCCMHTVQLMGCVGLAFLLLTWRLFGYKWTNDACHLHHGRGTVLVCTDAVCILVV